MRTLQKALASVGLVTVSILQFTACFKEAQDCNSNLESCNDPTGGSGGTPPPPPGCTDSPSKNADVIRDECAYFVGGAKGVDTSLDQPNAGSEALPFATLQYAVDAAKKKKARVYVCGDHAERIDVAGGVSIFGGFDCTGVEWAYDGSKSKINPDAPATKDELQASVRLSGGGNSQFEDLAIEAKDAKVDLDGASSIALIVEGSTLNLARTDITAGAGSAGKQPPLPTDDIGPSSPDDPAIKGNVGQNACMGGPGGNPGGAAKQNMLCVEAIGGKGGNGQDANSGDKGDDGLPVDPGGLGLGGAGEGGSQCKGGDLGANGGAGDDAVGADADGSLDATKGYDGVAGGSGTKGKVGQGGGGGGGSKGKTGCYGASGGSGGAGGCGGNGGLGGTAGGSSFGIVSLGGATLQFDTVAIKTGAGGKGGDGGFGQSGAVGGKGGSGGLGAPNPGQTNKGCSGGDGGDGGPGGQGGGGRGGHSIGIAIKGGSAPETTGAMITNGKPGDGGVGGTPKMGVGNGAAGAGEPTHVFL